MRSVRTREMRATIAVSGERVDKEEDEEAKDQEHDEDHEELKLELDRELAHGDEHILAIHAPSSSHRSRSMPDFSAHAIARGGCTASSSGTTLVGEYVPVGSDARRTHRSVAPVVSGTQNECGRIRGAGAGSVAGRSSKLAEACATRARRPLGALQASETHSEYVSVKADPRTENVGGRRGEEGTWADSGSV